MENVRFTQVKRILEDIFVKTCVILLVILVSVSHVFTVIFKLFFGSFLLSNEDPHK